MYSSGTSSRPSAAYARVLLPIESRRRLIIKAPKPSKRSTKNGVCACRVPCRYVSGSIFVSTLR